MYTPKIRGMHVRLGNIGASARLMVMAMFSGFFESRIAMAIKTASKVGVFCIVVLLIVALVAAGAIQSG